MRNRVIRRNVVSKSSNISVSKKEDLTSWDNFHEIPQKRLLVVLKVVTCLITFFFVLGGAVVSKGTLLFMASQIRPNISRIYCNKNLDTNADFVASLPDVERIAWIWTIIFVYVLTECQTFLCSLFNCLLKKWRIPSKAEFLKILIKESLPTIGTAIFLFCILPEIDILKGAMLTNAVFLVPSIIELFNMGNSMGKRNKIIITILFASQICTTVLWPILFYNEKAWLIPLSLFLISCGWWENFRTEKSEIPLIKNYTMKKSDTNNSFIYIFVALWKCILFLCTVIVIFYNQEGRINFLFENFSKAFQQHDINIFEMKPVIGDKINIDFIEEKSIEGKTTVKSSISPLIWMLLLNVVGSSICTLLGKFAYKVRMQKYSFALPINITSPVLVCWLITICENYSKNSCVYEDIIPSYLFFNGPFIYSYKHLIKNNFFWMWVTWLFSQIWITSHIWNPSKETEKLFYNPTHNGIFIDQTLAFNKIKEDVRKSHLLIGNNNNFDKNLILNSNYPQEYEVPKIYACATMWHESFDEMVKFFNSILLLDEDQLAKKMAVDYLNYNLSNFFELETHIFLDDAFIKTPHEDNSKINKWVEQLYEAIDTAVFEMNGYNWSLEPPIKYSTPYGGRLEWTLPGKSKLIVHLKDNTKIRNKKRWSQVMYMYYILGYIIMENKHLSPENKDIIAQNSYILSLDGDTEFKPKAVHTLVDVLKRDKRKGAICGRIHPTGPGIMMWYQKFDYAVAHWLQKATDYIFGTVLCTPGCFSLFRLKMLLDDDNILNQFSAKPQHPKEILQYYYGEDRLLTLLIINSGYKIDFNDESDSYTCAPTTFNDLFAQRRRWGPSTFLNSLDLVLSYRKTTRLSKAFVLYQAVLLIMTTLSPGFTFLMITGSLSNYFYLDPYVSLVVNSLMVTIFMFTCYFCNTDTQITVAAILSIIYTCIMVVSIVGIIIKIPIDGWLAPTQLAFFTMIGMFLIIGIFHPHEVGNLKYGIFYFVFSPTMNLVHNIYTLFNINNVSWGTRDNNTKNEENGNIDTTKIKLHQNGTSKNMNGQPTLQTTIITQTKNGFQIGYTNKKNSFPNDVNNNEANYSNENWMFDDRLGHGKLKNISQEEHQFWDRLIEHKLHPSDQDDKESVEKSMKKFRNKVVAFFLVVNGIFVGTVFYYAFLPGCHEFRWPLSVKYSFIYDDRSNGVELTSHNIYVHTIDFAITAFSSTIMLLQFIGMLIYRYRKFCKIMLNVSFSFNFLTNSAKDPIHLIKNLMKNKGLDDEYKDDVNKNLKRRKGLITSKIFFSFFNKIFTSRYLKLNNINQKCVNV